MTPTPRKVLHVIPSIAPGRGGPSSVVKTMAEGLADKGIEVHIATTDDNGNGRTPPPSRPILEHEVTYWIFPRQLRFYTFSLPLTIWLARNISAYDVVHIHALFSYPSVIAGLLARSLEIPYIIRPLGTLNRWGMRNRRPWLKRLSFRLIESRLLAGAAAVHCSTEEEANQAQELGTASRWAVVANPVTPPSPNSEVRGLFRSERQLDGKTILLFLSRLTEIKGLDLLLPAFAELRSRKPEIVLLVAGAGEPSFLRKLKARAEELGIGGSILWLGFLTGDQKRAALAGSDIFVLPSYSENFAMSVVEAMGASLPVIISDQVGIHREISEAGAGLVVECDVAPLAMALERAAADPGWRITAGENARTLAGRFAPEVVATQLSDLYDRSIRLR